MNRVNKVKEIIRNYYSDAECGCFFTRNVVGDPMSTIYKDDEIMVDICYRYSYFEIFGLTEDEEDEVFAYYEALQKPD